LISLSDARRNPKETHNRSLDLRRPATQGGAYTEFFWPEFAEGGGVLAGIPVAIKDLFDVAGSPTRAGSAAFRNALPARGDAPVVARLRRAGASIVGKTALHEIAFGTTGINDYEGTPENPFDRRRICGGSSSGSALAVAEGSAVIALGTDTGGSIRIPSAFCGIVGFKPQFGRLDVTGVQPLAKSLDHVGVMGADLETVSAAFAVVGGAPLAGCRLRHVIAIDRASLQSADAAVGSAVEGALKGLIGFELLDIDLPDPDLIDAASTAVLFVEAAQEHAGRLLDGPDDFGWDVRERLVFGDAISSAAYVEAAAAIAQIRVDLLRRLEEVDAVICPTVPIVAPLIEEARGDRALPSQLVRYTRLANITGVPAISLPVPSVELPVGLQILGRDDEHVLAVAAAVERSFAPVRL
jgi:Asp-tRNA(Asn)/Glu-tRNA(Gln) amidotransferase A subunit family amidase